MKPIATTHHIVAMGVTTALLAGTALAGCSARPAAAGADDTAEAVAVVTAKVTMTDVSTAIESGGVLQARTTATIAARILAPVRDVRVSPGDQVGKGQTLVVLAAADVAAAARAARFAALAAGHAAKAAAADVEAAQAGLVLARMSHDRVAGLHARRSATAQELDEATAALRSAEARVAGASARALQAASAVDSARAAGDAASAIGSFTSIPAPFDGTVTEKMVEPGNMASPGMPLLRLEDTRSFRLEVRVDESRLARIRTGDSVPVAVGPGKSLVVGTVDEVSRSVDADARAFLVKIALPDVPGLRSGQFGTAQFRAPPRRALTIPSSAIVRHGQLTSVFVVEEGRARVRLVNVRESEVVAGLAESEVVILSPPPGLTDGRRVRAGGR